MHLWLNDFIWYITYTSISAIYKKYSDHSDKKNNENISNKMKEDVGMSKSKKHANKVRWGTQNLTNHFHITLQVQLFVFCFISTYVGLYWSGLLNFGSHLTFVRMVFGGLTSLHILSFYWKCFFYYSCKFEKGSFVGIYIWGYIYTYMFTSKDTFLN